MVQGVGCLCRVAGATFAAFFSELEGGACCAVRRITLSSEDLSSWPVEPPFAPASVEPCVQGSGFRVQGLRLGLGLRQS